MRLLLIVILGAALASNARAASEDGPECFSKFTKFNVCEKAREAQAGLAATLPMKLNANITMSTAVADLTLKMDVATKNSVCSLGLMAAFVRLGGQVQYLYRTLDGSIVLSPVVAAC